MPEVTSIRLDNPTEDFGRQVFSSTLARKEAPEIKLGTEIIGEETNPTPDFNTLKDTSDARSFAQDIQQAGTQMQQDAPQIQAAYIQDPQAAHEARYRLEHQLAYFDSAEYAVRAQGAVAAYNQEYSKMLTPSEAEKLTKELGVDIKYNKNVQEGTVRFNADKAKLRKSIEDQLNEYRRTGDPTLLQQAQYAWSNISGSVGLWETLGTTALSVFTGQAIGAGLGIITKAAEAGKIANTVGGLAKGAQLAQKTMLARNRGMIAKNVIDEANAAARAARGLDFAGKLSYDALRMSQGVFTAGRASYLTSAIPLTVDAVTGALPHVLIRKATSNMLGTDEYSTKEAIGELLLAGSFGVAAPAAGSLARAAWSVGGKMLAATAEHSANVISNLSSKAMLAGRKGESKIAEITGESIKNSLMESKEAAEKAFAGARACMDNAVTVQENNLSNSSMANILEYVGNAFAKGTSSDLDKAINSLAGTDISHFMSNLKGMRGFIEEVEQMGYTAEEVMMRLRKAGIEVSEGAADYTQGRAAYCGLPQEGGCLGRLYKDGARGITAFTNNQARRMLYLVYKANMFGDVAARAEAQAIQDSMKRMMNMMSSFADQYGKYIDQHMNTEVQMYNIEGAELKYYDAVRTILGQLADAELGIADRRSYLKDALRTLDEYRSIHGNYENPTAYKNIRAELRALDQQHQDKVDELFDLMFEMKIVGKRFVYDMKGAKIGKGTAGEAKSETGVLVNIIRDLEKGMDDNQRLINSNLVFDEKYRGTDGESALSALMSDFESNPYQELFTYGNKDAYQNRETLAQLVGDADAAKERNTVYKAEFVAANPEKSAVADITDKIQNAFEKGNREVGSYFKKLSDMTTGIQELLDGDFSTLKAGLIESLRSNERLSGMLRMGGEALTTALSEAGQSAAMRGNVLRHIIEDSVITPLQDMLPEGMHFTNAQLDDIADSIIENIQTKLFTDPEKFRKMMQAPVLQTAAPDNEIPELASKQIADLGLSKSITKALEAAGIDEAKIASMSEEELLQVKGIGKASAEKIQKALSEKSPVTTANEGAFQTIQEQGQIMGDIMKDALQKAAVALMNKQSMAYREQTLLVDLVNKCVKTPTTMHERLLSYIVSSPLKFDEGALSAAHLMDITVQNQRFNKLLHAAGLEDYIADESNYADIQEAIVRRWFADNKTDAILTQEGTAGNKSNNMSQAERVAEIYAQMMDDAGRGIFTVGGTGEKIGSLFDPNKLSRLPFLKQVHDAGKEVSENLQRNIESFAARMSGATIDETEALQKAVSDITDGIAEAFSKAVDLDAVEGKGTRSMFAWTKKSKQAELNNRIQAGYLLLAHADLNKAFNTRKLKAVDSQEIIDSLLSGDFETFKAVVMKYSKQTRRGLDLKSGLAVIKKDMQRTAEQILGNPPVLDKAGNPTKESTTGLLNRIMGEMYDNHATYKVSRSKFVEDLRPIWEPKNADSAVELARYLGHQSVRVWMEHDLTTAGRAYGVLAKFGSDPQSFINEVYEASRQYIQKNADKLRLGKDGMDIAMEEKHMQSIRANLRTVCGLGTVPACAMVRISNAIAQILTSPLLMKAGAKSVTDYHNQYTYMVGNGFMAGASPRNYAEVVGKVAHLLQMPEYQQQFFMQQACMNATIFDMLDNNVMGMSNPSYLKDLITVFKEGNGLTHDAPALLKLEDRARAISDLFLNKMALVGPMTERNRFAAALNVMQQVGKFAEANAWADIEKQPQLMRLLRNHGVTAWEWDNVFRPHALETVDSYMSRWHGVSSGFMGDQKMFFADNIMDLDDATVAGLIKAKYKAETGKTFEGEVSQFAIDSQRRQWSNKAAVLINNSANEMTSMPDARIQNILSLKLEPNTGGEAFVRQVTKFQSFGTAVTYYQWAQRLAADIDPEDTDLIFRGIVKSGFFGESDEGAVFNSKVATSLASLFVSSMIANAVVEEALSYVTNTHQQMITPEGKSNIGKKFTRYAANSLGIAGPIFDSISGSIQNGSSIQLSVLPILSSAVRPISNIAKPMYAEGTEGNRLGATAAAVTYEAANYLGLTRHPFTQALFTQWIGNRLQEQMLGERAYKSKMTRAENRGKLNWLDDIEDMLNQLFAN